MGVSFLIFGGNSEQRKQKILSITGLRSLDEKTDVMVLNTDEEKKSIGIPETRKAVSFLNSKPFELPSKYLIILNAEKMTREAQNSLLKTLEEPGEYSKIFLSAKTEESLLPTVVSRCKKTPLKAGLASDILESEMSLDEVLLMTTGERLDWVKKIYSDEKENLVELLENWVRQSRGDLEKNSSNIKEILKIHKLLENTNINKRLALETLVLKLI